MVNIIVDYLRQKANALTFIADSYGLAEIVERQDGDTNKSYPAIYKNGELVQISFDTHPSLIFFTLDGEIERTTDIGETSSCNDQVTETYKIKAYFFNAGKEISDCASITQQSAYAIAKFINANNTQLETALNLQEVKITTTSFDFNKKSVWDELHNNIPYSLSERQQLCSISFDVFITGIESCFVGDPCDLPSYTWSFDASCCYTTQSIEVDIEEGLQSVNHHLGGTPDLIQYWQGANLFAGGFTTNVTGSQVLIDSTDAYEGIVIKLIKFTGTCSIQQRLVRDIVSGVNPAINHNLSVAPDIVQFWINGLWLNMGFSATVSDTQIIIESSDDYDNVSIRLLKFDCGENQSIGNIDLEEGENTITHELSGVPDFIQFQQNGVLLPAGFSTEVSASEIVINSPDEYNGITIKAIKF